MSLRCARWQIESKNDREAAASPEKGGAAALFSVAGKLWLPDRHSAGTVYVVKIKMRP